MVVATNSVQPTTLKTGFKTPTTCGKILRRLATLANCQLVYVPLHHYLLSENFFNCFSINFDDSIHNNELNRGRTDRGCEMGRSHVRETFGWGLALLDCLQVMKIFMLSKIFKLPLELEE